MEPSAAHDRSVHGPSPDQSTRRPLSQSGPYIQSDPSSASPAPGFFERHAPEVVDTFISEALAMRKQGIPEPRIMQEAFTDFSDDDASLAWEIALARLQDKKDPRVMLPLFMTRQDLRFATHLFIAEHRAKRLACATIVEIGCGIGSQTIAFSRTCKKVIAVDNDPRKIAFAKANCRIQGATNVEFVCADGVEALEGIESADAIFCDPERAPSAAERTIDDFSPSIMGLIELTTHRTPNLAIELPPQMKDIPINGELEYASIDGKLARLTLYRGGLARCAKSAVALPKEKLVQDTDHGQVLGESETPQGFLFEVDEAVVTANLCDRIKLKGISSLKNSKPYLLTANKDLESPFFRARFTVVCTVAKKEELNAALKTHNAQKAIIRYKIDPADYWKERKALENGLDGTRHFHIIPFSGGFVVGEKIREKL